MSSKNLADTKVDKRPPWKRLSEAKSKEEFAQCWLTLQSDAIEGVHRSVIVMGDPEAESYAPAAFWPEGKGGSLDLNAVAELAMEQEKGVVRNHRPQNGAKDPKRSFCHLALPFLIEGRLFGAVALELEPRKENLLRDVMRQLQWGSAWVEIWFRKQSGRTPPPDQNRLATVLELIASGLENERFQSAANAVVTDMAVQLDCERVSLGFVKRNRVRVMALSHSAKFNQKSNLIKDIGTAMDEALDQRATIIFPPLDESTPLVNRVHAGLAQEHGDEAVCTVPLGTGEKIYGALTFEKAQGKEFEPRDLEYCETIGQMVGPILLSKRREDRWIITKVFHSIGQLLNRLFGPRHLGLKLGTLLLAAVVYYLSTATADYRISADTKIEGAVQRVVVAPMGGYVDQSFFRPGDIVKEGDLLFKLEDKDLVIERLKWKSQIEQFEGKYRDALANFERSEIRILKAQLGQAEAKLELAEKQLSRTRVYSPFDGIIISGDLSQSLGAPVERGEVLFQLAPLDEYRVILKVDEKDIAEIQPGQKGQLILSGIVEENLSFVVKKVTPVTEVEGGGNYFRVEAQLVEHRDFLRPGMEGVGKIEIDNRKLIWILTHASINWVRLKIWTWWP